MEPIPVPRTSTINLYLLMAKQSPEDEEFWRRTLDQHRAIKVAASRIK